MGTSQTADLAGVRSQAAKRETFKLSAGPQFVEKVRDIVEAARSGARLALLEMVVPEDAFPHPSKGIDLVMLTALGGRESMASLFHSS